MIRQEEDLSQLRRPTSSHFRHQIYGNGLKFERDRTFRNKLIMKAILIMASLLIAVAFLCVITVKSSNSTTIYNKTKIIQIYKKGINIFLKISILK